MQTPSGSRALKASIVARLRGSAPSVDVTDWRLAGMTRDQSSRFRAHFPERPTPAAVLVPIVDHAEELTLLLTVRSSHLKNHGGQIAFPGGRIEPADGGPARAALREAEEEVGLDPSRVAIVGYLPDHLIVSGYRVTPVVGFVEPGFTLRLDPKEVDDAFEVPLRFLFDPLNHKSRLRRIGDEDIELHDIPFGERNIWGATAGMLLTFYRLVMQDLMT